MVDDKIIHGIIGREINSKLNNKVKKLLLLIKKIEPKKEINNKNKTSI